MAFAPQFLDEIRDRVSLASVVARHVKLIRRGREYIGLCPFHNEKTPSFSVVEDKGFYHCFGCGAHGDVIGFAMRVTGSGFRETIVELAKEAGLKIPEELPEDREREARAMGVQDACEAACGFFEQQLQAPGGRTAREYLARRGVDPATIAKFRLGWAPDARDGLRRALGPKVPETVLLEAGLLRRPETGEPYDFFRGRVMFPIFDRSGKVIAFGGRVIGDGQPKYLNSPDTPIFDKGRTLYGAHLAKAAPRSAYVPIVTEGYMDVIALHQAGFAGAVAPLGTALTEAQLMELWRLGDRPVLCFDGDAAGRRAALRALDRGLPMLRPEVGLRFVFLLEGEDPDSFIKTQGPAAFRTYLEAAVDASEFIWRVVTEQRDPAFFETPEKLLRLEARIGRRIRAIENGAVQREFQYFLNGRLWDLRRQLRRPRDGGARAALSPHVRAAASVGWADATRRRRLEGKLVGIAIMHPQIARAHIDALAGLEIRDRDLNELWQCVTEAIARNGELTPTALRAALGPHLLGVADRLATVTCRAVGDGHAQRERADREWRAALAKYHLPAMEREKEAAIERWSAEASEESWAEVLTYREEIERLVTESAFVSEIWEAPDAGSGAA
jgi:DNA primase